VKDFENRAVLTSYVRYVAVEYVEGWKFHGRYFCMQPIQLRGTMRPEYLTWC